MLKGKILRSETILLRSNNSIFEYLTLDFFDSLVLSYFYQWWSFCIITVYKKVYFDCTVKIAVLFITEDWYPEGKQNIQAGHLKEALVPSLNPWTVYHLRMFAENQLGKSKEGKVVQVRQ